MTTKEMILQAVDPEDFIEGLAKNFFMSPVGGDSFRAEYGGLYVEIMPGHSLGPNPSPDDMEHAAAYGVDITIRHPYVDQILWRRAPLDQAEPALRRALTIARKYGGQVSDRQTTEQIQRVLQTLDQEWGE